VDQATDQGFKLAVSTLLRPYDSLALSCASFKLVGRETDGEGSHQKVRFV
jgi:hypothetical protein